MLLLMCAQHLNFRSEKQKNKQHNTNSEHFVAYKTVSLNLQVRRTKPYSIVLCECSLALGNKNDQTGKGKESTHTLF